MKNTKAMRKINFKKIFMSFSIISLFGMSQLVSAENLKPLVIEKQGSFTAGGKVFKNEGVYDFNNPLKPDGQTYHGDHAYVSYQIPQNAKNSLVFLHGAGQSAQTWETTPDGREGFNNIFLRKGYSIYLLDQPRRGRAGKGMETGNVLNTPDEQFWLDTFRISSKSQFAKGEEAMENFFRQMTPNTGAYNEDVVAEAVSAVFDKIGEGVLITHSQGGGPGWRAVIKNPKIKGVVSYEPRSGFVFPEGETPEPLQSSSPFGALSAGTVSMEEFMKFTKIPIVIYYGDNIADKPSEIWNEDHWRVSLEMAELWAEAVNRHGGDVRVVHLPKIGVKGNTHFPFSDLNNLEIADLMEKWLEEKGLDK